MKLLDRLLLRNLVVAWLICFTSLVSLYIVIDAFPRLEDFMAAAAGAEQSLARVVLDYYAVQLIVIFDRLCGVMTLLAALFTLAWMQKSNELTPLLAAGVPLRRVLRPVLLGALLFTGLAVANRELLLPLVGDSLQRAPNDPGGRKLRFVNGMYDTNGTLIEGFASLASEQVVYKFACTLPPAGGGDLLHLKAREARYVPPGRAPLSGGWLLTETTPAELAPPPESGLTMVDPGKFFLKTQRADFERLTRNDRWQDFATTQELRAELEKADTTNMAALAMELHSRFVGPAISLLGVLMGIALMLRSQQRGAILNLALCLALAAALFAVSLGARYLGQKDFVDPALAAWLPILMFGPPTLVLLDGMVT